MMEKQMRLDKFLCEMGIGSRSQVKGLLKKNLVTVNGAPAKRPEQKILPSQDAVCFQGRPVTYASHEYYMLHKPAGCVTATEDPREKTVLFLLTKTIRKDLFPVGRLDKDTEGLLLITNDGELSHRLLSPKKHVPKTYFARVKGEITEAHIPLFLNGLDIGDDRPTLPASLELLKSGEESQVLVTITEGRYHQVKRMFLAVGAEVTYLKRLSMGPLRLDEGLSPGQYRPLTAEELSALKSQAGLPL